MHVAGGEFVFAGDDRHAEAAAVGVFQLLAQFFRLRVHFHAEASSAQLGGQPQILVQSGGIEIGNENLRRRRHFRQHAQLFHAGQQAIQTQRGADAWQLLIGVERREVIVTAAGADAAQIGQGVEKGFVNRAGVIIEPAGDDGIDFQSRRRHSRGMHGGDDFGQSG